MSHDDALHLYALAYCEAHEGVADYRAFFAAVDAINRSAPTSTELASSLLRLSGAGLVRASAGAEPARVTEAGRALYDRVNAGPGTVFDRLARLEAELAMVEQAARVAGESPTAADVPSVDPAAFAAGYRAYYGP